MAPVEKPRSNAAPPLAEHHSSPVMAASATAADPSIPIYISSDEDDEVTVLGSASAFPFPFGTSMASSSSRSLSKPKARQVIDLDDDSLPRVIDLDGDDDSLIFIKEIGNSGRKKPRNNVRFEVGECSYSANDFDCVICMETVPGVERFAIPGCGHAFCAGCVRHYIAAKVEENMLSISCPDPGCKDGSLHPKECRDVIPAPLFQRWGAALCEMALGELKFYCPFNDCSALLVDDEPAGPGDVAAAAVTVVECPHCARTFCAQCKVPWHDGVDCAKFQLLGEDERGREDLLLRKVASESKWRRCPKCKMYVERADGCVYIVCRCSHRFCYLCGSPMVKGNHHCSKCKRTW